MTRIFNLQEKGENKTDKIIIRIISVILAAVTLSGISGGTDIAVFDSQFKLVKRLENCGGEGYTKQGMEVYGDYLLCLRHWSNCIEVYNKNGEFLKKVSLPVTLMEPEFICIANGECYIGYNLLSYTGGCIYKISEMKILPDFEGC